MENMNRIFIVVTVLVGLGLCLGLYEISAAFVEPQTAQAAGSLETSDADMVQENQSEPQQIYQLPVDCSVSQEFPDKILRWCDLISQYAGQRNLDPDLLAALILQESGGNPQAYSHSGAVGLMQVMPRNGLAAGFMCKNGPCFKDRPTINELEDPEFNISYGSKMLAGLINKKGSVREALKSYGPMDVGYSYSDTVLSIYKRYRD